jgi:hypothetical protein
MNFGIYTFSFYIGNREPPNLGGTRQPGIATLVC